LISRSCCRADFCINDRKPTTDCFIDFRKWIVAAHIEQDDVHFTLHRRQRVQEVIEPYRLHRNIGFALPIYVDFRGSLSRANKAVRW
jgi:hypothetical protein